MADASLGYMYNPHRRTSISALGGYIGNRNQKGMSERQVGVAEVPGEGGNGG